LSRLRDADGFTLVELLVSMPFLVIILAGLTITLTTLMRSNDQTREEATLQTEARAALDTITTDIRESFVGDGTTPILAASPSSITLESPDRYPTMTSGGVQSSFHLRKLTYTLTARSLQRQYMTSTNTFPAAPPWTFPGQMGAWQTLVGSITNTNVFAYYTDDGIQSSPAVPLTFPINITDGIRAVGVTLSLSTGGTQPKTFTVTDTVALRETDSGS
jgi:type II secretory pathway pseudopilin PulG